MFTHKTEIRIHYALTDQMGVVYYGNYAQFYEIGRAEALRHLGLTYKSIESLGIIMLVTEIHTKFLRPAFYDDLITVATSLKEIPVHHKIVFHSEIFNEKKRLLNVGEVTLYFMDARTMKRCEMPNLIREKLEKYFEK